MPHADPTFNDELTDAMIGHQTGLLRFSGSVRNKIWALLDATEADLKRQIRAATTAGLETPRQVAATERLIAALRKTRLKGWKEARATWFEEINALAQAEPEFFDRLIGGAVPVELASTLPAAEVLRDIVTSRPFEGKTLRGWADNIQRRDLDRIEDQIKIGLAQNESLPALSRRIVGTAALRGRDGVTQITRRQAGMITRTVVSGVTSAARDAYLELNQELSPIKLFVATLDSNTTPICRSWDGSQHSIETGKTITGPRTGQPSPVFPLHFGERSLFSPLLDGEVVGDRPRRDFTDRQLIREYARDNDLGKITGSNRKNLPRGHKGAFDDFARARMRELTGTTPATTTYQKWLGRQSAANQDDILGPTRGALFRRGGLTLDKFVLTNGTELTLPELAQRNAAAFERANLDPAAFR